MIEYRDPAPFDIYNARNLTPEQVAKSFIPSKSFFQIIKSSNHIVVGPRGSGKTTLLKMLQLPALLHWENESANKISSEVDFLTAFIPADEVLKKQYTVIDQTQLDTEVKKNLKHTFFLTHTIQSILRAFEFCFNSDLKKHQHLNKFYIDLPRSKESHIVASIAEALKLGKPGPNLASLEIKLEMRMQQIGEIVRKHLRRHIEFDEESNGFIDNDFLTTVRAIIRIINTGIGKKDLKWTLAFDELEVAPAEVRKDLLKMLRSNQEILFKLSFFPYTKEFRELDDPQGAHVGHDFQPMDLTYAYKVDARKFCEDLFAKNCMLIGLETVDSKKVFGYSVFELGNKERQRGNSAYINSKTILERFERLIKKDKTFNIQIRGKKISHKAFATMDDNERARFLRKITSLVCVQEAHRGNDGQIIGRKQLDLYTGDMTLFDITEANPRVYMNVISPLLEEYAESSIRISKATQKKNVYMAKDRFITLLNTIPTSDDNKKLGYSSIKIFLDSIGKYFFERAVKDSFSPDCPLSFVVDRAVPESVLDMLGDAINAGALIHVPQGKSGNLLKSLVGERFRLNYLLAVGYGLPLYLGPSRILSNVLSMKKKSKVVHQVNLFDYIAQSDEE